MDSSLKRRRDMLHGYAISMLVVFLGTLVVGIVWQNTLFVFPEMNLVLLNGTFQSLCNLSG